MKGSSEDKISQALKNYEVEQYEFETHPIWKELGTTPKDFFNKVNDLIQKNGISQADWQQKLNDAKHALNTRIKEKHGKYEKFNLNQFKGLRV